MIYYSGRKIKLELEGESHSECISIKIYGLEKNSEINLSELDFFMQRRHGDGGRLAELCSTRRREPDKAVFDKGVRIRDAIAVITGDAIEAHIDNTDVVKKDYDEIRTKLRPGHADLGVYLKYGKEGLKSGGGEFSGRMTAGICVAGGMARQILSKYGIEVIADIETIGGIKLADGNSSQNKPDDKLIEYIKKIKDKGDSLGGTVTCSVKGMPGGIGGSYFDGLESSFAYAMFGIPSVKGIEFGSGLRGTKLTGSQNNDEYFLENKKTITHKNDQGGISGGISTGMDIDLRVYFKPIPSIRISQKTVDVETMKETEISVKGRHDVCVVPRVLPVVEALASIVILDRIMDINP
ncbi:MAG TPA: chorismate synthase [Mogibacterium sp.]|nr:chorismate synthase [Mogibacterium sp.]